MTLVRLVAGPHESAGGCGRRSSVSIPGRVVVDRAAFFALTAAIATACHTGAEPSVTPGVGAADADASAARGTPDAVRATVTVPPPPEGSEIDKGLEEAEAARRAAIPPPSDAGDDSQGCAPSANDAASLAHLDALCNSLHGPTCESMGEIVRECKTLAHAGADGFRPAIAGAVASCLAERNGKAAVCEGVGGCLRTIVRSKDTCITSDAAPRCDALVRACKENGSKVHFSRAQCLIGMSMVDDAGLAADLPNAMLAPTHEGCTFDYFLPYSPFSKPWTDPPAPKTVPPPAKPRAKDEFPE